MIKWLVEEIADGGAERAGQDEGRPEQQHTGHLRPEIEPGDNRERRAEETCSAKEAKPGIVRHPVAQRRAKRLRERDRHPVERLDLGRVDRVDRDRLLRPIPGTKHGEHADQEDGRAAGITDAE